MDVKKLEFESSFFRSHDFVSRGHYFLSARKILLYPIYLMGFCGNRERKNCFKIHAYWNKDRRLNTESISLQNTTKIYQKQ